VVLQGRGRRPSNPSGRAAAILGIKIKKKSPLRVARDGDLVMERAASLPKRVTKRACETVDLISTPLVET